MSKTTFEWNDSKNELNEKKHGVSFMKKHKRVKYTDEPIGEIKIITDFYHRQMI